MKIKNSQELDHFLWLRVSVGGTFTAIKRDATPNDKYEDGTQVIGKINTAWRCNETQEVFEIIYE
jgi:hypothetical protein